jgi:uncharacterized membrane protein
VPYAPQSVAAIAMYALNLRPFLVFYLGRLFNLAFALALMAVAMRMAPDLAPVITAVVLLPMTLTLFASWSPDAMTFALATLLTALLLVERAPRAVAAVTLALSLCKPAYFLIALLALPARYRRSMKIAILATTAIGTVLAMAYLRIAFYPQRMFDPISPGAQMQCFVRDPMRFVRALGHALAENVWLYVEQIVGRTGADSLMNLPVIVVVVELLLLVAVGMTTVARRRALTAAIVACTVIGIFFSQYLVWSVACGEVIEGVQGRYFLPLLPLGLTLIALPRLQGRMKTVAWWESASSAMQLCWPALCGGTGSNMNPIELWRRWENKSLNDRRDAAASGRGARRRRIPAISKWHGRRGAPFCGRPLRRKENGRPTPPEHRRDAPPRQERRTGP